MNWFKRKKKGIVTPTSEKMTVPDGLWYKTPKGKVIHINELKNNAYVCPDDNYHFRIGSKEYFSILFDENRFTELNKDLNSTDPLSFSDIKSYASRVKDAQKKTGLKDAIRSAYGKMNRKELIICCMDFDFIGGSMGSVVGEKISRSVDEALAKKIPFLLISKSGGARMQEASLSLMQMAKTTAKIILLSRAKIPYISLLTDPTTGGVTASFAMLGDLNIAEPQALIGFAGPRVIQDTIGKNLPEGFQRAEFLLECGFLDFIVYRNDLKSKLTQLLHLLEN